MTKSGYNAFNNFLQFSFDWPICKHTINLCLNPSNVNIIQFITENVYVYRKCLWQFVN